MKELVGFLTFCLLVIYSYASSTAFTSISKALTYSVHDLAVVSFNQKLYVIGGDSGTNQPVTTVTSMDPNNNNLLVQETALPLPRCKHAAAALGNKIYVISGWVDNSAQFQPSGITTSVLKWAPGDSSWTAAAPIPAALQYHTATTAEDGKIYVYGGSIGPNWVNYLYSFDGTIWVDLVTGNAGNDGDAVGYHAAALVDNMANEFYGQIYYFGGAQNPVAGVAQAFRNKPQKYLHSGLGSGSPGWIKAGISGGIGFGVCCESYGSCGCPKSDPSANCGSECYTPLAWAAGGAASAAGGQLYLFGGATQTGNTYSCQQKMMWLNVSNTATWHPAADMAQQRGYFGYAKHCDGSIYIFGGLGTSTVGGDCTVPLTSILNFQPYSPALTCSQTNNPTPAPGNPTPAPVNPTPAPVNPTPAPVNPTPAPVNPTPAPANPTPAPANPTPAPVVNNPTPAPGNPTPAPGPNPNPTPGPGPNPTPAPGPNTNPTPGPGPNPTPGPGPAPGPGTGKDIRLQTWSTSSSCGGNADVDQNISYTTCYPISGKGFSVIGECPQGGDAVTIKFYLGSSCSGTTSPLSYTKTHLQCWPVTGVPGVSSFKGTCWALVHDAASSLAPTTFTLLIVVLASLFFKYEN